MAHNRYTRESYEADSNLVAESMKGLMTMESAGTLRKKKVRKRVGGLVKMNDLVEWRKQVRWIAQQFIERSGALNYKGKKRDDAAMDYFVGAAQGMIAVGRKGEGEALGIIVLLDISTRGFKAVERLANQTDQDVES